ncbi:MAG: hypothetical protein GXP54_05965 [Deltaproteobacteria bacterium]|nr:hypothetical protein [Deltaproteobacteria bacterium]
MHGSDASFWYQYLVGSLIFGYGMYLGFRNHDWSFHKNERGEFILLVLIMLGYMAVQGFFQFLGPRL